MLISENTLKNIIAKSINESIKRIIKEENALNTKIVPLCSNYLNLLSRKYNDGSFFNVYDYVKRLRNKNLYAAFDACNREICSVENQLTERFEKEFEEAGSYEDGNDVALASIRIACEGDKHGFEDCTEEQVMIARNMLEPIYKKYGDKIFCLAYFETQVYYPE